jgi:hypothetical protein
MKDMESETGFLVSKMEEGRKTNWEQMKATITFMWFEVDETIQQQVGNIMTHNQETQSLQKPWQGTTTTWHEAMEAYCKIGNIFPLSNPRVKCERFVAFRYFLLSISVGYIYSELYKGNIKNVFKCTQRHLVQ